MIKQSWVNTVRGPIPSENLGLAIPHEHLFTDLRGPYVPDYAQADGDHVASVMKPFLDEVSKYGVTALVECSTIGVGRNPKILKKLGDITSIHIIAPTGIYREAYVPKEYLSTSAVELAEIWTKEITEGIEDTDIRAGFIKMAVSDDGISDIEKKNLEAAVITHKNTGAIIASHTIGGDLAREEMNILEKFGLDLQHFIWTHAQSEPDKTIHLEAADRGTTLSIDAIGSGWVPDEDMLDYTLSLIEAGYSDRILLSHDAGWYDPSQPDGYPVESGIRGYTKLFETFLPDLRARGVNETTIEQITIKNPARAFSITF